MKGTCQKYIELILMMLALVVYFLTRLIWLDADPPGWHLVMYQPLDEPVYTYAAFNMYNFGKVNYEVIAGLGADAFATQFMMLMNAVTYFTLVVAGNNYYGLRLAAVLIGILVIVLFYVVMIRSEQTSGRAGVAALGNDEAHLARLFIIAYMVTDFCFLLATRIQEPTVYRLFAFAIIMYALAERERDARPLTLSAVAFLGLLTTTMVLLTYPGNIFIIPACLVAVLYLRRGLGVSASVVGRSVGVFTLGVTAGVFIFNFILVLVFDMNLVASVASIIGNNPDKSYSTQRMHVSGITEMLKDYAIYIGRMLMANFLRYNGAILTLFLISIPFFVKRLLGRASALDVFMAAAYGFLILQGLVLKGDAFMYRQLLVQQLIVGYVIYKSIPEIYNVSGRLSILSIRYSATFLVPVLFGLLLLSISASERYAHMYAMPDDVLVVSLIGLISVFLLVSFARYVRYSGFIAIMTFVVCGVGVFLSYQNIYKSPEFGLRDVQKSISSALDGEIVAGDFAHAFRLYNKMTPVLNYYRFAWGAEGVVKHNDLMKRLICEDEVKYAITNSDKRLDYYNQLGMIEYDRITYSKDAGPLILFKVASGLKCLNN